MRTLFEYKQTQHRFAIVGVTAQAIAGFGRIGDEATAFEVGSDGATLTAINANMMIAFSSNPASLPQLTQQYISAVQSSESLLGADVARQKLSSTALLVAPHCGACAQSMNAASAQIGG